jgi:hypothetical protein
MRRLVPFALVGLVALSACVSDVTAPDLVADPALSFDEAHARWLSVRPPDYSFEFEAQGAMVPSPGFFRATVLGGRLVEVSRAWSGEIAPIEQGFTIDQLWERLSAARARGEPLSELQFSREGIPMRATAGSFANDGGVRYQLRAYVVGRWVAP